MQSILSSWKNPFNMAGELSSCWWLPPAQHPVVDWDKTNAAFFQGIIVIDIIKGTVVNFTKFHHKLGSRTKNLSSKPRPPLWWTVRARHSVKFSELIFTVIYN